MIVYKTEKAARDRHAHISYLANETRKLTEAIDALDTEDIGDRHDFRFALAGLRDVQTQLQAERERIATFLWRMLLGMAGEGK